MSTTASPNRLMYSRDFILNYSHIKKEDTELSNKIATLLTPVQSKTKKLFNPHRTPFGKKTALNPEIDTRIPNSEKKTRTPNPTRYPPFTTYTPDDHRSVTYNAAFSPTKETFSPTHLRTKSLLTADSQKENVPHLNSTPLKTQQPFQKRLPKTPSHFTTQTNGYQTPHRKSEFPTNGIPTNGISVNHLTESGFTVVVSEAPYIDNAPSTHLNTPITSPIIKTPRVRHVYQPKLSSSESNVSNQPHSGTSEATPGAVHVPTVSGDTPDTQNLITPPSSPLHNLVSPTIEPRSPAPVGYQGPGTPYKSPKPKSTPSVMTTQTASSEAVVAALITGSALAVATPAKGSVYSIYATPAKSSALAVATPAKGFIYTTPARSSGSVVIGMSGTPAKSPKSPRPISPLDEQRLLQRQKQIDYGYRTVGYLRYRLLVSKEQRKSDHPRTPKKTQGCSKRSWDGQLKKWRRDLHLWDPDNLDAFRSLLNSDLVVGMIATNPELEEIVRIVREKMDNPNGFSLEDDVLSPCSPPPHSSSVSDTVTTSLSSAASTSSLVLAKVPVTQLASPEAVEKKVSPSRIPADGIQKVARALVF